MHLLSARHQQLQFARIFRQVRCNAFWACIHAFVAFVPASWTHFTVFFSELQSVNHAQHFVYVTTQWQVVHHLVLYHTVFVDQE